MKKIGILTACRTNNIGTDLQAYAMNKIFSQYADVEIINYRCDKLENSHKVFRSFSPGDIIRIPYFIFKNITHYRFRKSNISLSKKKYNKENISQTASKYDAIVVGSDQIWNMSITGNDLSFFCPWDDKNAKKYSYAASFGKTSLQKWEEKYSISSYLKDFCKITVREESGVMALKELGINSEYILDPILCADKNLWKTKKHSNDAYSIIYQVGGVEGNYRKDLQEYAICNNQKIIRISPPTHSIEGIRTLSYVSMEKWINLMANAQVIITDSYHGLSFAIANNCNFRLVLLPDDNANTRSLCLLERLGLTDFIWGNRPLDEEPSWEEVNKKLDDEREKAKDYIKMICGEDGK